MKKFIVSTPHPDSLAGADYRQDIFGPFNSIPEAEEFRDWFHKKFIRGAGSKEDLIQIGELNDPLVKLGFRSPSKKMTDQEKIEEVKSMIVKDCKMIILNRIPFLKIRIKVADSSTHGLCVLVSYVRGVIGFDLYDRDWYNPEAKHLETMVRKMPKLQDASLEIKKDIKWIKMKIKRIEKKYNAPISSV